MASNQRRTVIVPVLVVVAVAAILYVVFRPDEPVDDGQKGPPSPEELIELLARWNRGNDALDHFEFETAERAFRSVAERLPDEPDVWANVGIAAMNQDNDDAFIRAEPALRRAVELDGEHPHGNHALGVLLKHFGGDHFPEAARCFRRVLASDPHDPTAAFYLGTILVANGEEDEAERLFEAAIASEPHQQSAVYALAQLYYSQDKVNDADSLVALFQKMEASKTGNRAGIVYSEMGRYGDGIRRFPIPLPDDLDRSGGVTYALSAIDGASIGSPPPATERPVSVPIPAGTAPADLVPIEFSSFGPGAAVADVDGDGDLDVYAADAVGSGTLWIRDGDGYKKAGPEWSIAGAARSVSGCFGDYDNDGFPDLYIACAGPNRLLHNEGGKGFKDVTAETGTAGGNVFTSQAVMADLDADGDVDIYCANLAALDVTRDIESAWPKDWPGAPNALFNNDRDGTFTDIAARTKTDGSQHSSGVVAADLDGDRDADLVVFGLNEPLTVYRNDRIWRFVDATASCGLGGTVGSGASVADLDRDGDPDIVVWGTSGAVFDNQGRLAFTRTSDWTHPTGCVLDADNDGDLDRHTVTRLELTRRGTAPTGTPQPEPWGEWAPAIRAVVPADLDGDGILDLVLSRVGGSPLVAAGKLERDHRWVAVGLKGVREVGKMRANTGGIGANVTVISGTLHQSQQLVTASGVLGSPPPCLHFGLGAREAVDYVSINWPDDLLQGESVIPTGRKKIITQVYRKSSSCPLLFAHDGERMAFVTDFLGTGGLGFFLEPGSYAQPDPTELVWIPSLAANDGMWTLSIHEAMEELCYLDEAKLIIAEHDEGLIVVPDERLSVAGPAPTGRLIAYRPEEARYPTALSTLEGEGDARLLRHGDRRYQPGVHPDRRFIGYAAPQEIVLDFGNALEGTEDQPIVLFLDGWVEYPYAHVNFAAWQAGLSLEALSVDVREADGSWRTLHDRFGYPAGMPRVMTLDVSELPRTRRTVIRLRTNIELYIDRIWLAPDHGPSAMTVRELAADSAVLKSSGYPREYSPDGREPLLYDYALMDPAIDYKMHTGAYTKFGDVRPLLNAPDDRYVIFGRAEEIVLGFKALPDPPAGRTRSFILKSDGYCKDMDLYTAHPTTVGPLPFHGMTTFPYPPSERFPTSEAHEAYRREWNTRVVR